MVEVLVSLAISSVALLALAGVNAASVRYSKMSQYRAVATLLANDIAERMRANKGVDGVPGSGFLGGGYSYPEKWEAQQANIVNPTACNGAASNCNQAAMAAFDLTHWRFLVRNQLPDGSVYLSPVNAGVGTPFFAMDLWIAWRDPAVGNADERTVGANECHADLKEVGSQPPAFADSIRCSYFRINI